MTMKKVLYPTVVAAIWSLVLACSSDKSADISPNSQSGIGGSMARFTIVGNALYCVLTSVRPTTPWPKIT